jgi:hypothetical protein
MESLMNAVSFDLAPSIADSLTFAKPTGSAADGIATKILELGNGTFGLNIDDMKAALANILAQDPQLGDKVLSLVTSRLTPVETGELLSNRTPNILESNGSLEQTVQLTRGVVPSSASKFINPASPAKAPKTLIFSAPTQRVFDTQWNNSFPGGRSKEQGGTLVYDKTTGAVSIQNVGGTGSNSGSFSYDFNLKDPSKYAILGTFHTHPYDSTEGSHTKVAHSGPDIANMINRGNAVSVVQSGDTQFMLVRTAQTPASVDRNKVVNKFNTLMAGFQARGFDFPTANKLATTELAKSYNLAFYQGSDGYFSRIYPK